MSENTVGELFLGLLKANSFIEQITAEQTFVGTLPLQAEFANSISAHITPSRAIRQKLEEGIAFNAA